MESIDMTVENGIVYTPGGFRKTGIGIDKGKIVSIAAEAFLPSGKEKIDATGRIVLPGLIDPHVHFRDPGFTYKEDFETGTKAAVAGGVTLIFDMPNTSPPTDGLEAFEQKKEIAQKKALVDFSIWAGGNKIKEIPRLLEAGAIGIKLFMVKDPKAGYPHDPLLFTGTDGSLLEIFKTVATQKGICAVHPNNQELFEYYSQRCWQTGKTTPLDFAQAYYGENFISDDLAVVKLLLLARATGVRLHILHMRSKKSVEMGFLAKKRGLPVSMELNPKYLFFNKGDLERLGPYVMACGLTDEQIEELWDYANNGTIDVIGTDHAPHTREEMEPGWKDAWSIPFGNPQVEHFLPMLLTEVNKGRISLERVVKLCSENIAKLFRLFPRKGAIQVGSDADLVIVDLNKKETLSSQKVYTKCGWTPYHGREVTGMPVLTMVRGKVVMADGKVIGSSGYGSFVKPVEENPRSVP